MLLFTSFAVIFAAIGFFALVQRKVNAAPAAVSVRVRSDRRRARR